MNIKTPLEVRERHRKWRLANPERVRAKYKKWREKNVEVERARARKYYAENRDKERLRCREWARNNPDKTKEQRLRRDPKKMAVGKRKYRECESNRVKIRAYKRKYDAIKNATDPEYRLRNRLRLRILRAIKEQYGSKAKSTISLLGCSIQNLRIYLESKFETGMTWENHGTEWQIDHIMPCAIFDLTKPEHQRRCFHFSNLQPLWAMENYKKGGKPTTNQFQLI